MQTMELFSSVCCRTFFIANLPESKNGSFFWQNDSGGNSGAGFSSSENSLSSVKKFDLKIFFSCGVIKRLMTLT